MNMYHEREGHLTAIHKEEHRPTNWREIRDPMQRAADNLEYTSLRAREQIEDQRDALRDRDHSLDRR